MKAGVAGDHLHLVVDAAELDHLGPVHGAAVEARLADAGGDLRRQEEGLAEIGRLQLEPHLLVALVEREEPVDLLGVLEDRRECLHRRRRRTAGLRGAGRHTGRGAAAAGGRCAGGAAAATDAGGRPGLPSDAQPTRTVTAAARKARETAWDGFMDSRKVGSGTPTPSHFERRNEAAFRRRAHFGRSPRANVKKTRSRAVSRTGQRSPRTAAVGPVT
jgi:hypothetical protein